MNKIFEIIINSLISIYTIRHTVHRCTSSFGDRKSINSIIIYSNTALGDTLLSTPAIKKIRELFPCAKITWFIHEKYYPLFQKSSCVNDFILYRGGYKGFISNILSLRQKRPDLVVMLHSNAPQDIQSAVLSGASWILKTPTKSPLKKYLSFLFSEQLDHAIKQRMQLVEFLAGREVDSYSSDDSIRLWLSPAEEPDSTVLLPQEKKAVGLQVGASDMYKMWPIEFFAQLAQKLLMWREDIIVVLLGDPSERHLSEDFFKFFQDEDSCRVFDAIGKTTILSLPSLLKELCLVVSNDTGTMHLSVALEIPVVALFGNTNSRASGIIQDLDKHVMIDKSHKGIQSRAIRKKERDNKAMRRISVQEVFEVIQKKII